MWLTRAAPLLASACLLTAHTAQALWPHPTNYTENTKMETFVRLSNDLTFQLADATDPSRVPSDLKLAMANAAKLANTVNLWPVMFDRGENYRHGVAQSPLVSSVRVTVLELLTSTTPNPCVAHPVDSVVRPRSLQQPFTGGMINESKLVVDGYGGQQKRQKDGTVNINEPDLVVDGYGGARFRQREADTWGNPCSIAARAIKELNYNTAKQPLNITTDKSAPADLGYLDAEMYHLEVPADGSSIQLTSYTALGALRGLQTLLQLIYALPPQSTTPKDTASQRFIRSVPISITDRPAYPYRGLMLDTARNWFDIPTIRKLIDTMSFVKMNQLHWHATDTQSWPLAFNDDGVSDGVQLSLLAQTGSYGWYREQDGSVRRMVYTEEDIKGIIDYAAKRGINVIIETDMPAHMLSGVESLDNGNLMACPNSPLWQSVAAEPPSGQLRLVSNDTASNTTDVATFKVPPPISEFVSALLKKVSSLSKSVYVSSGGDEPNWNCWNLSTEADLQPYITPFMQLVTNVTTAAGKKGMVWEEMAVKFNKTAETLAAGSLVTIWNDANNSRVALENNNRVDIVLAPVGYFYLDCGQASFLGNYTGNSWCPLVSWQKTYSFFPEDTIANATAAIPTSAALNTEQRDKLVRERFVGGEHAVWSETIDASNVESKVWPRAAAGAEVFWTGEKVGGVRRDAVEALPRMMDLRYRLVEMGVGAEPLQPLWCALRPGQCNFY